MAIRFSNPSQPIKPAPTMEAILKKQAEVKKLRPALKTIAGIGIVEEQKRERSAGRPKSGKETVTLRVDTRVVAYYKTFGEEWREAMIDDLKRASHL